MFIYRIDTLIGLYDISYIDWLSANMLFRCPPEHLSILLYGISHSLQILIVDCAKCRMKGDQSRRRYCIANSVIERKLQTGVKFILSHLLL